MTSKLILVLISSCFLFVSLYVYSSIAIYVWNPCENVAKCSNNQLITISLSKPKPLEFQIKSKNIILTFCNDKFINVFNLWYSHYIKLTDLVHDKDYLLLLMALDNKSYDLFNQTINKSASNILIINALTLNVSTSCNIPPFDDDFFDEEQKLARFRHCVVKTLLKHSQSVTMSDLDAIWLKNPFSYFEMHGINDNKLDNNTIDIISSTGTYPKDCHSLKTYETNYKVYDPKNLCMGFIHYRNTKSTLLLVSNFWNSLQTHNQFTGSDQKPFNCYIYKHLKKVKQYNYHDITIAKYRYKKRNVSMIALSQKHFVRNCDDNVIISDIYIMHCWMTFEQRAQLELNKTVNRLAYFINKYSHNVL